MMGFSKLFLCTNIFGRRINGRILVRNCCRATDGEAVTKPDEEAKQNVKQEGGSEESKVPIFFTKSFVINPVGIITFSGMQISPY